MRMVSALSALALTALAACPAAKPATQPATASPTGAAFTERASLNVSAPATTLPLYPLVYRFDPGKWVSRPGFRRASDGAVEVNYGRRYGGVGWQFNPVSTAQLCLTAYNEHAIDGRAVDRSYTIDAARSLLRRAEATRQGIVWRYAFPNTTFGLHPLWISGMAQGLGAACLAGAYKLSGTGAYLHAARRAFGGLTAPYGYMGTAARAGDGVFYEELAGGGTGPTHTLNGMIFALAGIDFLQRVDPRPATRAALAAGVRGVASLLPRFDAPGMSLYDLGASRPAGPGHYNRTHIAQMVWLAQASNDTRFLEAALRFASHERNVPFTVTSSLRAIAGNDPEGMTRYGGSYEIPAGRVATLTLRLLRPEGVDEIVLFSPGDAARPARVEVSGGRVEYTPKRVRVTLAPAGTRTLSIRVTAPRSSAAHIDLITLSNPRTRALSAVSSDLGLTGPALATLDGRGGSKWTTTHPDAWLLFALPSGTRTIRLSLCAASTPGLAFGASLGSWTRPAPATGEVEVPDGARYALLRWPSNGCLAELAPQP